MNNRPFFPEHIFVEKDSLRSPVMTKIKRNVKNIPIEIVASGEKAIEKIKYTKDPIGEGKKNLLVSRQKGSFIKPCPCTPHYVGCNYFIINADINCPLDCSYCILQQYLDNPLLTVYSNSEKMWAHVDDFIDAQKGKILRIGTGELGDSLALDHITERSKDLITYFKTKMNVLFELKTKTTNIRNIMDTEPGDNIVIAWSLNSEHIAREEETGAPSAAERIAAAQEVSARGYKIAFHFDPLIRYKGWKEGYAEVIDSLKKAIDPKKIAWVSLGSLRFPADLKARIKQRSPQSKILYEEFIRGNDGKLRYFKPLRKQLYNFMVDLLLKGSGKQIPLYLCMESDQIWQDVLKKNPRDKEDVERSLTLSLG
jgi:spore photoproduct lyase